MVQAENKRKEIIRTYFLSPRPYELVPLVSVGAVWGGRGKEKKIKGGEEGRRRKRVGGERVKETEEERGKKRRIRREWLNE
jgi:hypothetical protein